MIFCQLGRAQSLREIEQGLASAEGRLEQLGVGRAAKRTTRAYANAHRPWKLYEDVFHSLYARCHAVAPGHKFRFKNPLLSLDASTIDLCAAMFDWAKFKRTKGAVKLHLLLDHDGHLPRYAVITDGKTSDIEVARRLELPSGSIVVFDRVRENLKIRRRDDLESILNDSINQTLSRTVISSGLTFLTVMSLYLFGGEVLHGFSFALVVGILIGTYSSIAVAAPMLVAYQEWRAKRGKKAVLPAGKKARV